MARMNWGRAKVRETTTDAAEDARALAIVTAPDRRKARRSRAKWVMLPNGERVHASQIRTHDDYVAACASRGIAV